LNIFVRNLSHEVSEADIRDCFAPYGHVTTVTLIGDSSETWETSRPQGYVSRRESRGYAYIEMPDQTEALAAIIGAQGKQIRGLAVMVLEALPLERRKLNSTRPSGLHRRGGPEQSTPRPAE